MISVLPISAVCTWQASFQSCHHVPHNYTVAFQLTDGTVLMKTQLTCRNASTGNHPLTSYSTPTHLAQNEDPWNRLNATATLSSARKDVCYFDPKAPRDSLDLNLKSMYNHQKDLLLPKNETVFQRETFTEDPGRILKNRVKEGPPPGECKLSALVQWVSPRKETIDSVDGAIGETLQ
ncbi:cilia- and flagella-associated protein 276 isoform X2 [Lissotriton helveticus]